MINYSILNNYIYPNKSRIDDYLDCISFPLRTCLGGRTVKILEAKEEIPSFAKKTVYLILSFALFPIAVAGAACLLLTKATACKRKVTEGFPFLLCRLSSRSSAKTPTHFITTSKKTSKTHQRLARIGIPCFTF